MIDDLIVRKDQMNDIIEELREFQKCLRKLSDKLDYHNNYDEKTEIAQHIGRLQYYIELDYSKLTDFLK